MNRDRQGLEILSRAECLLLLGSRSVGRVALTRNALPAIYPVFYTLVDEDVVFATGAVSGSLTPVTDAVIAFEVDDVDLDTRWGWSVLVVGIARRSRLNDSPGAEIDLRPWATSPPAQVMRLPTDHLTGRRLASQLAVAARRSDIN